MLDAAHSPCELWINIIIKLQIMADIKEMRIFCAEQIEVPDALPEILKNYSKAVIRENPENIISFSRKYFENLKAERDKNKKESEATLDAETKKP